MKFSVKNCMCYYFHDIIKFEYFCSDNVLIDEKSNDNFLIYNISYKILYGPKTFRIRFNKIDEFVRVYNGSRYLLFFGPEKYDVI